MHVSPVDRIAPILLLVCSNVFTTFAWYGRMKFEDRALWIVVLVNEGNRLLRRLPRCPGESLRSRVYSAAELKALKEVITLAVFAVFPVAYLGQGITANHMIGFALIAAGAVFNLQGDGFVTPIHDRFQIPAYHS